MIEPFEVFALHYAQHSGRSDAENFLGGDPHDSGSDLAYFVWVARRSDRLYIIDTGFGEMSAARRGRTLFARPADLIAGLGIAPAQVTDVILTHLHYDHAGTLADFPAARFHVQDGEVGFATGRCMCHPMFSAPYDVEDVVGLVRKVYAGRVVFHDGDAALCDGLSLHRVPGHTAGLQVVRIWTARGWIVLASDASHLYANLAQRRPFSIVHEPAALLEGYRRLLDLAGSPDAIIPGHDPEVARLYPPHPDAARVSRLHLPPIS